MVALVFEIYGGVCLFSLIAFLVLASVAKLRPDLDEEEFEFLDLEKIEEFESPQHSSAAVRLDASIIKDPPRSAPSRKLKQSKRLIERRPYLFHHRKPRTN